MNLENQIWINVANTCKKHKVIVKMVAIGGDRNRLSKINNNTVTNNKWDNTG